MCYTDGVGSLTSPGGAPSTKAEAISSSEDISVGQSVSTAAMPGEVWLSKTMVYLNAIHSGAEVIEVPRKRPLLVAVAERG